MDFIKLKEIAKHLGGILVMQGNEPEFVIMPYEKYAPTASTTTPTPNQADDQLINQLNNEILALKEEIRQKESAEAELI